MKHEITLNTCKRMLLCAPQHRRILCLAGQADCICSEVQKIFVDSEKLAKALLCLLERWQAIILMCYYLQLKDKQIVRNANGKPKTERANHVRVTEEERH